MKSVLIALVILAMGSAAFGLASTTDATVAVAAKAQTAKVDAAAARQQKQAAKQLEKQTAKALTQPLLAQVVKVEGTSLTVKTQPLMGPDGLIPSKEKSYDTTNATVVLINGMPKALGDLVAGALVHLQITEDGKTVEHVAAKAAGAKKAAAAPAVP